MKSDKTLKENITWLLEQYKKELEIEKRNEKENNYMIIVGYENIIMELEFALKISK